MDFQLHALHLSASAGGWFQRGRAAVVPDNPIGITDSHRVAAIDSKGTRRIGLASLCNLPGSIYQLSLTMTDSRDSQKTKKQF